MQPLFTLCAPLILASASPRRQQFLQELGIAYTTLRPQGVEPAPLHGESPADYALRAAKAKAEAVARQVTTQTARVVQVAQTTTQREMHCPPHREEQPEQSAAHLETRLPHQGLAQTAAHHTLHTAHTARQNATHGHVILAADTVVAVGHTILGKPRDDADALRMLQLLRGRRHTVISAVCLLMPHGRELFYDATDVIFFPWDDPTLRAYVATGEPADKAGAYAIQGQGAFLVQSVSGSWATVVGLPIGLVVEILLRHRYLAPVGAL